ncbi:MAG: MFS transporter, partial [Streptosporangiales bacterium]
MSTDQAERGPGEPEAVPPGAGTAPGAGPAAASTPPAGPGLPGPDASGRDAVERHFTAAVRTLPGPDGPPAGPDGPVRPGSALTGRLCLDLFAAQLASRHLDLAARWLRAQDAGFYTIGSSGHEGNAGIAAALRLTDPALLHYRSGGFYLARCQQATPPHDGTADVLLGLVAAAGEPIAGGRHKVFGHRRLHVIPQTSTIASHLPRAMG